MRLRAFYGIGGRIVFPVLIGISTFHLHANERKNESTLVIRHSSTLDVQPVLNNVTNTEIITMWTMMKPQWWRWLLAVSGRRKEGRMWWLCTWI